MRRHRGSAAEERGAAQALVTDGQKLAAVAFIMRPQIHAA